MANLASSITSGITDSLKSLFIPSVNPFSGFYDIIIQYFPFIDQIKQLVSSLVSPDFYGSEAPVLTLDFSKFSWGGSAGSVEVINFDWYSPFKGIIHGIILFLSWGYFIFRVFRRLPALVVGNNGGGEATQ